MKFTNPLTDRNYTHWTRNYNWNRPLSILKIESVIQNLPTKKTWGPNSITGKFYETFKEEIISTQHKLFQKTEEDFQLPLQGQHYPNVQQHYEKRKPQASISHEHKHKNSKQILANRIQQYTKKIAYHDQVGLILQMEDDLKFRSH